MYWGEIDEVLTPDEDDPGDEAMLAAAEKGQQLWPAGVEGYRDGQSDMSDDESRGGASSWGSRTAGRDVWQDRRPPNQGGRGPRRPI